MYTLIPSVQNAAYSIPNSQHSTQINCSKHGILSHRNLSHLIYKRMHFHIYLVMMARNPVAESALCHITVPAIQQATDRRMGRDAVTNIKTIIRQKNRNPH